MILAVYPVHLASLDAPIPGDRPKDSGAPRTA
jgi:hypothetical protein